MSHHDPNRLKLGKLQRSDDIRRQIERLERQGGQERLLALARKQLIAAGIRERIARARVNTKETMGLFEE